MVATRNISENTAAKAVLKKELAIDSLNKKTNDFIETYDFEKLICSRAVAPLDITVPAYVTDENNELVHPCILYVPDGWSGYKYWLCANPYPGGVSAWEQPCLFVSNDGENWVEPSGLTNPIVQSTEGQNSDSFITLDEFNDKMICIYRETGTSLEAIYYTDSLDGITWSDPRKIIDTTEQNKILSPSLVYVNGKWLMFSSEQVVAGQYHKINIKESEDLINFSENTEVTISGLIADQYIWHLEVRKYNGVLIMLAHVRSATLNDNNKGLYVGISYDVGQSFEIQKVVLQDDSSLGTFDELMYKSTFVFERYNTLNSLRIWYGTQANYVKDHYYKIALTRAIFDNHENSRDVHGMKNSEYLNLFAATKPLPPYIFGDLFNRANSSGLGTASSGLIWQTVIGSIDVINRKAGVASDGNHKTYVDIGVSSYTIEANFKSEEGTHQDYILISYTDSTNMYRVGWDSIGSYVQKLSTVENVTVFNTTVVNYDDSDYIIKIVVDGTNCKFYIDDELQVEFTLEFTSTKVGLQIANTITTCEYFTVLV